METEAGYLSNYFEGIAAGRLTATEVDPEISNQHEFQGRAELREILGTPTEKVRYDTHFMWIGDEEDDIETVSAFATWSDVRSNQPHRSPEYHLYYAADAEQIVHRAQPGDLVIIARMTNGNLLALIVPAGSTVEQQLDWLFDLHLGSLDAGQRVARKVGRDGQDMRLGYAARFILSELGIEVRDREEGYLERMLDRFGAEFPTTAIFSAFARETLDGVAPVNNPDDAVMAWMDREELLFRTLERHLVAKQLEKGFGSDVDEFISYSLSVQNRRKSRAGLGLENHVEQVLREHSVQYVRGAETENKAKPDFLFPGLSQYHDNAFPSNRLTMLGVKSTCKERWRQVLSEAARIDAKHLMTLEPGISANQTNEMQSHQLQLVVPEPLHETYQPNQQSWLMDVSSLLNLVKDRQ